VLESMQRVLLSPLLLQDSAMQLPIFLSYSNVRHSMAALSLAVDES
jgi:hypothetical protein